MTLLLVDGFEDLSSWTPAATPTVAAARNGNGALIDSTAESLTFSIPTALQTDTLTVGFAIRWSTATPPTTHDFIQFRSDGGTTTHNVLEGTGFAGLNGCRSTTNILVNSSPVLTVATWAYVEFQAKLHDTAGTMTIRVNGTVVASGVSLDTKNAGTKAVYDAVLIVGATSTPFLIDDLYISNDSTFLGDVAVETLYPNGNGAANQWVGSDGNSVDNYLLVDETGTPVTADYTGSATAGQQDLYTLTDLVRTTGTVKGVCHQAYAAKNDSGAKQFKLVNRRATNTASAAVDLTTTFAPYHYGLDADPEGGAWTLANVNALQSGVEVA